MDNKTWVVYIMMNKMNTVNYTGVTNDLGRRVYEHKNKINEGFTNEYNITKLVYYEHYESPDEAITREKQIKGWVKEKKIQLIETINPYFKDLYNQVLQ